MSQFSVSSLQCHRCGHVWLPRRLEPPKICPACKRDDWAALESLARRSAGRPLRYPELATLEVGQAIRIPLQSLANGQPDYKANARIWPAVTAYGLRSAKRFGCMGLGAYLHITRIS